ncbi:MAG: hypothetical protein PHI32_11660 [Dysgonamonadaceae bacterium]|nr:hypothetical protein [Dysgonamonadaceae bacterium]MDD4729355.1 hypothetical protein [Dysgonamonadaceae bacterium]
MKFTTKLLIFWASVFLMFLLGVIFVMTVFWGVRFNFWHISVAFILNGVIPPAIITSFFYNRLDYMESENDDPPTFTGLKKLELPFKAKSGCPFDELLHKVDRQYIISYSDRKKKIVKFRTDTRMLSWGIGGYLNMVDDSSVEAYVYPVFKNSRREELVLKQTLRVLHSIFNQC